MKLSQCIFPLTKCLWAGNFLAMPKNSFISTYSYKALLFYWKKNNKLINYFLIDYMIKIAYDNFEEFRNLIDKVPYIDCNIFQLTTLLNDTYKNKSPIQCSFNKIKRREYNEYNNGQKTNLRYICDIYQLDLNNISNYDQILK